MCLIAFDFQPGTATPLVVAANRDEFHDRPTRAAAWWDWPAGPLAGRDLSAGGTWMAVGRDGRFAAVTNYRDPHASGGERSRGELPTAWLGDDEGAAAFGAGIHAQRDRYAPFSLLYGGPDLLWVVGTHTAPAAVTPGVHALSNHLIDTPWPKSIRAVRRLEAWRESPGQEAGELLDLLDDRQPAGDDELPDTGVGRRVESLLSAPFIVSDRYGTRSSTALVLGERITLAERTFDRGGNANGERVYTWSRVGR